MTIKFKSDIDIDFADREQVISLLNVTQASILRDGKMVKHNTGVYATDTHKTHSQRKQV